MDPEDGCEPFTFKAARLVVQHHGDEALLWAELARPDEAILGIINVPDTPSLHAAVEALSGWSWRVSVTPSL